MDSRRALPPPTLVKLGLFVFFVVWMAACFVLAFEHEPLPAFALTAALIGVGGIEAVRQRRSTVRDAILNCALWISIAANVLRTEDPSSFFFIWLAYASIALALVVAARKLLKKRAVA